MRPLDVAPPPAPQGTTETKKGLFSRLFKKKETAQQEDNSADLGDLDLDAIKEKIGLYKDEIEPRPEPELEGEPDKQPRSPPPELDPNDLPPLDAEVPTSPEESAEPTPAEQFEEPAQPETVPEIDPSNMPAIDMPAEPELAASEEPVPEESASADDSLEPVLPDIPDAPDFSNDEHSFDTESEPAHEPPEHSGFDTLEGIEEPISIKAAGWDEHADEGSASDTDWEAHAAEPPAPTTNWEGHPEDELLDVGKETPETPLADASPWADHDESETEEPAEPLMEADDDAVDLPANPAAMPDHSSIAKEHLNDLHKEHKKLDKQADKALSVDVPDLPERKDHPHDKKVEVGKEFILKDGKQLTSIRDLVEEVKAMDADTWKHHVSEERNDFANWLQHVLHEEELAEDVRAITSKKKFLKVLRSHERQADKHLDDHQKAVDEILGQEKNVKKASELKEKMHELQEELKKKKEELEDARNLLTEHTHKKIEEEIQKRVQQKEDELALLKEDLVGKQAEYEDRLHQVEQEVAASYADRETDLNQREAKIKAKHDSLLEMEKTIHEERRKSEQIKNETMPLIEQAEQAKAEINGLEQKRQDIEDRERKHKEAAEKLEDKEHELVHREEQLSLSRSSLNQLEQQVTKQDAQLKKEQETLERLKADFEMDRKRFKSDEKKRLADLKAEQRKIDDRLKRAEDAEQKLESKLQEKRKISSYIADAEKLLSKSVNDAPSSEGIRNLHVYQLIDEAKAALSKKQVAEARELYNQIREAFNKEKLEPTEKAALYSTIRELYDDIHMASMRA